MIKLIYYLKTVEKKKDSIHISIFMDKAVNFIHQNKLNPFFLISILYATPLF